MRQATIEELKQIQIEILDVTSRFCDEHNIKYWIDGGTLIGAVRHNGYIPWDDDIDLGMLRPDFDRFIREFNGYNDRYIVRNVETDPDFTYAYAKVLDTKTILYEPDETGNRININIDIFVYDNAPDNPRLIEKMFNIRDFYRELSESRTIYSNNIEGARWPIISKLKRIILKMFPRNYFTLKEIKNAKKYSTVDCQRVGNFVGWARLVCEKDVFNTFIEHEFEGKRYKIPGGYHKWLTNFYGDYMKLPPLEQQVSHHKFKAFIEN